MHLCGWVHKPVSASNVQCGSSAALHLVYMRQGVSLAEVHHFDDKLASEGQGSTCSSQHPSTKYTKGMVVLFFFKCNLASVGASQVSVLAR